MPHSHRSLIRRLALALVALGTLASAPDDTRSHDDDRRTPAIRALAPVDVLAAGFSELSGIAVDPDGAVLVTDRARGTLTRVDTSGQREVLLDHLEAPDGIAVDTRGTIFVLEARARRVLRLDAGGLRTIVASGLRQARAITVGPDDTVWLAVRRTDDERGDRDRRSAGEHVVARLEPDGTLTSVASGFVGVQALAADGAAVYVAMRRLAGERGALGTLVARVPIREDGTAAPIEPLLSHPPRRALGLAVDAMGDLFVGAIARPRTSSQAGLIVKRHGAGDLTEFAGNLIAPAALAFAPNGDLLVAERVKRGRILRFRAPSPPAHDVPAFTNRAPLPVIGRAGPQDQVAAFSGGDLAEAVATTIADAASGAFRLDLPLAFNAPTAVAFVATAAAGAGLASARAEAHTAHDDHLPSVAILEPPPGIHTREIVTLRGTGADENGVTSITFMVDDSVAAVVENDHAGSPFEATATLDTRAMAEGPHTVTASAVDRADNSAAVAQLVVVDRTPPDTRVVDGPGPETAETTATFTVAATDVQSAVLEFSWRLDMGAWSPYSPATEIVVRDLESGMHTFEVKARDLAGNEDRTPSAQSFTVSALRVVILEPASGSVITTSSVWVRGTVAGAEPVVVSIPLPVEFRALVPFEAITATPVAGTFAVEVPVTPSTTVLTVTARGGQGATITETVAITVAPPLSPPVPKIDLFPAAGLAPLTVAFSTVTAGPAFYSLDLESDGVVDYTGGELAAREFVYARPGVYLATLWTTAQDGVISISQSPVTVYDRVALEAQLRTVWTGFKDALRSGAIERAGTFIHGERRERWVEYLRQLPADALERIDDVFTDVTLVEVSPGRAECEMMREVNGVMYSFPISFITDVDGGWRLWMF